MKVLHTPHVDLLAIPTRVYNPDIFVVCFTVGEPVRQIVFGVLVVSRMPCKSDGEVNAVQ